MEQVVDAVLGLDGAAVYVVVGLLAFGEAAAFVGLLLPGEVAVLLGGVLAAQGRVSLPVLLVVVSLAAIAGDSAGYELGRRWGSRFLATRTASRHASTIRDVMGQLQRHGGAVVFLGRWTSVLRAVVPALAGMSRMAYGRFLAFNVLGGVAWAAAFTLAGHVAGASYRTVEAATGRGGYVVAAVIVAWAVFRLERRRHDPRDDVCCAPDGLTGGDPGGRSATPAGRDPVETPTERRASLAIAGVSSWRRPRSATLANA